MSLDAERKLKSWSLWHSLGCLLSLFIAFLEAFCRGNFSTCELNKFMCLDMCDFSFWVPSRTSKGRLGFAGFLNFKVQFEVEESFEIGQVDETRYPQVNIYVQSPSIQKIFRHPPPTSRHVSSTKTFPKTEPSRSSESFWKSLGSFIFHFRFVYFTAEETQPEYFHSSTEQWISK